MRASYFRASSDQFLPGGVKGIHSEDEECPVSEAVCPSPEGFERFERPFVPPRIECGHDFLTFSDSLQSQEGRNHVPFQFSTQVRTYPRTQIYVARMEAGQVKSDSLLDRDTEPRHLSVKGCAVNTQKFSRLSFIVLGESQSVNQNPFLCFEKDPS